MPLLNKSYKLFYLDFQFITVPSFCSSQTSDFVPFLGIKSIPHPALLTFICGGAAVDIWLNNWHIFAHIFSSYASFHLCWILQDLMTAGYHHHLLVISKITVTLYGGQLNIKKLLVSHSNTLFYTGMFSLAV